MNLYHINMARDYVMTFNSRRKWIRWLGLYLVLMGVVIAVVLYRITVEFMDYRAQQESLNVQSKRMMVAHPEFKTAEEYKSALIRRISGAGRDLNLVLAAEQTEIPLSRILLGLAAVLPGGVEVNRLEFNGETHKIGWDVVMLADHKRTDGLTPPRLVSMWEQEPLLSGCLGQFEVETSDRVKVNGVPMISWRFSAMAGGGAK